VRSVAGCAQTRGVPEHTHCPHCRRALADVEETDEDHVVTESLGGVTKITTCKRCNSKLGGGVEARLVGPHGLLTLLSQAQGWTEGALWGETEQGTPSSSHFGQGEHRLMRPHVEVVAEDDDRVRLAVTWPSHLSGRDRDRYLQRLAKQHGGQEAARSTGPAPETTTRMELVTQAEDLRRVAAKIALSTGAEKWGDEFTLSALADWLREVLDVWSDWPPPHRLPPGPQPHATGRGPLLEEEVKGLTEQLEPWLRTILARHSQGLPVVGHIPLPPPMTVLTPVDYGKATMVNVMVLGVVLPGLGAPHPLVPTQPMKPQVIQHPQRRPDTKGRTR
jgi:hypothetical protein